MLLACVANSAVRPSVKAVRMCCDKAVLWPQAPAAPSLLNSPAGLDSGNLRQAKFQYSSPMLMLIPGVRPDLFAQVRRLSGEDPWQKHLRLQKCKEHFLWTIESTGKIACSAFMAPMNGGMLSVPSCQACEFNVVLLCRSEATGLVSHCH